MEVTDAALLLDAAPAEATRVSTPTRCGVTMGVLLVFGTTTGVELDP